MCYISNAILLHVNQIIFKQTGIRKEPVFEKIQQRNIIQINFLKVKLRDLEVQNENKRFLKTGWTDNFVSYRCLHIFHLPRWIAKKTWKRFNSTMSGMICYTRTAKKFKTCFLYIQEYNSRSSRVIISFWNSIFAHDFSLRRTSWFQSWTHPTKIPNPV